MNRSFFLILLVITFAIVTSCENNFRNQPKTLRIGTTGSINLESPFGDKNLMERIIFRFIHGTLVSTDTLHASITASLAKDWLINIDSSRFILYLSDQLFFTPHSIFGDKNTRVATALDVVGSIKGYITHCKENAKQPAPFENLIGIEHFYDLCSPSNFLNIPLDGAIFSNDHTLVLEFYEPIKELLNRLSDLALPIVPYDCLSSNCSVIPGFGFYRIEKTEPSRLVLEVLPDFRQKAPYEKIEIISNLTYERLNQFLTEGTIDMAVDLRQDFINIFLESNIQRIRKPSPDFNIISIDTTFTTFAIISSTVDSSIVSILKKLP